MTQKHWNLQDYAIYQKVQVHSWGLGCLVTKGPGWQPLISSWGGMVVNFIRQFQAWGGLNYSSCRIGGSPWQFVDATWFKKNTLVTSLCRKDSTLGVQWEDGPKCIVIPDHMRIASFLCVGRALLGINLYLDDNAQLYYCVQTAIKKKPQTRWPKRWKFVFSQFCRLEVPDWGADRFWSWWEFSCWLTDDHCPVASSYNLFSTHVQRQRSRVSLPLLLKTPVLLDHNLTLSSSFNLHYLHKGPISKYYLNGVWSFNTESWKGNVTQSLRAADFPFHPTEQGTHAKLWQEL